jgi:YidC/Oxa1 family membrane protein insertase
MFFKQRKQNPEMAKNPSMGCMTFMSPVMSLWFTFMFPAGVGVYWIISNIISFIQQVALTTLYSPKKVIAQQMVDETVTRRSRENNVKRRVEIEKK